MASERLKDARFGSNVGFEALVVVVFSRAASAIFGLTVHEPLTLRVLGRSR